VVVGPTKLSKNTGSDDTSQSRQRQPSRKEIIRQRKEQSRHPLLKLSLDFPVVFKREEQEIPVEEQIKEMADTIRQHGLCVIRNCVDRAILQQQILPNTQKMFQRVGKALDKRKIVWHTGLEEQQPDTFRFQQAASRCKGRIDIALVTENNHKNKTRQNDDIFQPFQNQEISEQCLENPQIYPVIQTLLGAGLLGHVDDDENGVQLVYAGLIFNLPDSDDQPWHQDGMPLFPEATNSAQIQAMLPPYALNVFIPLETSDGDLGHGPTEFLPGSHRWTKEQLQQVNTTSFSSMTDIDTSDDEDAPTKIISPVLKQGDVLIYDYRVCHRGTSNLTVDVSNDGGGRIFDNTRKVLYLMYARKWFTDHVNFDYTKNAESLWT
jgi:ectoine hydroxylase-related dioxygenase (phytanoyl-CoA dioxygenase family)